jgi:hypothetical protein
MFTKYRQLPTVSDGCKYSNEVYIITIYRTDSNKITSCQLRGEALDITIKCGGGD